MGAAVFMTGNVFYEILFSALEMQTQKGSHAPTFASMTWTTQVLLKWLYIGSLYSWMSAMLFSSTVKYANLWYASAAWSGLGLALITIIVGHSRRAPGHALPNDGGVSSDDKSSLGSE